MLLIFVLENNRRIDYIIFRIRDITYSHFFGVIDNF